MFVLNEPAFKCEEAAYEYIEGKVWPDGPVCPHCQGRERIGRLRGQSTKVGTYKCYSCRKPFNVKIGTMLESTHVPLHMWLQALFLLHTCKPGISIHRLHHVLGVSSRTTWLMAQRVRAALAGSEGATAGPSPESREVRSRESHSRETHSRETSPPEPRMRNVGLRETSMRLQTARQPAASAGG